jgi:hypothetical protein
MRNALVALILTSIPFLAADVRAQAAPSRQVFINRVRIPDATLAQLEGAGAPRVPDGRYWYDRISGAWGLEGGFTRGFIAAGIPLGGPLPADISGGGTRVYFNGRELHPVDLTGLQQLVGPVAPGRYWIDAQGNAGMEKGPATVNLRMVAAQLYRQNGGVGENYGGGGGAYSNSNTGIGIITDGQGGAEIFSH